MDLPKGVSVAHGARTFRGCIPDVLAEKLGVGPFDAQPEVAAEPEAEVAAEPKSGKKKK